MTKRAHVPYWLALSVTLLLVIAPTSGAIGPTSTLYITSYGEFGGGTVTGLDRVQGLSVFTSPTGNPDDICIATAGDVRTMGYTTTESGSRFDLAGNPLPGGPYINTIAFSQLHDGTSDGTYNYAVDWPSGAVLRFTNTWTSPSVLFSVTPGTAGWITMDVTDGTFWLSQYGLSDLVEHRDAGGNLLSSFNSGIAGSQGLALDPVDGTLWMSQGFTLYQFNQTGLPLQSASYLLPSGQWFGMEFDVADFVPEPGSLTLLAIGAPLLLRRRRRPSAHEG